MLRGYDLVTALVVVPALAFDTGGPVIVLLYLLGAALLLRGHGTDATRVERVFR